MTHIILVDKLTQYTKVVFAPSACELGHTPLRGPKGDLRYLHKQTEGVKGARGYASWLCHPIGTVQINAGTGEGSLRIYVNQVDAL